ncbi:MAG: peptidoglycan-binding protein [Clostridia bacterium]|nr:peptidoglycan-binding protein [Clostridia bacterium]
MKDTTRKKLLLPLMLTMVSLILSGCYTEPEVLQSGADSTYGGNVPYYPVYVSDAPATATPTPDAGQTVVQTAGVVVVLPNTTTPEPQVQSTNGVTVILPSRDPTTPPPVTNTPRPTATPTATSSVLKFGSQGQAVRDLQRKLKALGFYTGNIDGDFGESTKRAVTNFQRAYGLTADGVAGNATLQKLETAKATAVPTRTPTPRPTATPRVAKNLILKRGTNNEAVRTMQTRLISLGYLNGKATGSFDAITEQAVIAFQNRNTDLADGVAGYDTLTALYGSNARRASASSGIIGISLKEGASDTEAVKTLQRKLKALGYFTGTVDGDFGTNTTTAVKNFQRQNGMTADGVAGGRTLTVLFAGTPQRYQATATPKGSTGKTVTDPPSFRTVTNPPAGSGYITLKLGDSGTPVKQLQTALRKAGYLKSSADGKYGDATYEAVKAFQTANGLKADGVAGKSTLDKLFGNSPTATPTSKTKAATNPPAYRTVTNPPVGSDYITLRMGDSGAPVKQLQEALKKAGYFKGTVDSKYGASTYEAVKEFQKVNGLTQNGVANRTTLNKLFGKSPTATPTAKAVTNPPSYRTVTNPPVGSGYITLKMGDSGAPVTQLQNALKKAGYFKGTADGKYGGSTYEAVRAFQKANGLTQNGVANTNTLNKIFGLSPTASPTPRRTATPTPRRTATPKATKTPSPTPKITNAPYRKVTDNPKGGYITLRLGDQGDPVKRLQTALRKAGYYKGNSDGKYDSATYKAVSDFQGANGLTINGVANAALQRAVFEMAAVPTPTRTPKVTATPKVTPTPVIAQTNPPSYRTVTEGPEGADYLTLRVGDSGDPVRRLQQELKKQGYFKGTVDGRYGLTTQTAVIKLQKAKGLRQDGVASPATQRVLFEGDFPSGA